MTRQEVIELLSDLPANPIVDEIQDAFDVLFKKIEQLENNIVSCVDACVEKSGNYHFTYYDGVAKFNIVQYDGTKRGLIEKIDEVMKSVYNS